MNDPGRAEAVLRAYAPDWSGNLTPLARGVFRAEEMGVVVKCWQSDDADKAARQVARQSEVADLMTTGPFRVPRILAFDPRMSCAVMTQCAGQTLADRLANCSEAEAEQAIRAAGGWLAAYHKLSLRRAPFRPFSHLKWLDRRVKQGQSGALCFPDKEAYRREVFDMHKLFEPTRRLPSIRAVTHKDCNIGNLILSDSSVWGIDLENAQEDEPIRDLFALGVEICALTPHGQKRRRALRWLSAGYDAPRSAAEVRLFLQRCFALGLWARTPSTASYRQQARLVMAQWILKQDEPLF